MLTMRSSGSFISVSAILLHVVLVSAGPWGMPGKKFGEELCKNMNTTASHSKLLEGRGNRTTCVVSVANGKTDYLTAVGTVKPLEETTFDITGLGKFELKLTGECALDPCYKVTKSPEGMFTGNYVYSEPGVVDKELAFIAVYDCKGGKQLTQKAEFYAYSKNVVRAAERRFGFKLTEKDLKDCFDRAEKAASE